MVDLNWEMQNKAWLSNGVAGFNFNLTKSGAGKPFCTAHSNLTTPFRPW